MLRILVFLVVSYIVWKIVRIFTMWKRAPKGREPHSVEFPQDTSYKNIEDADFEDIPPGSNDKS